MKKKPDAMATNAREYFRRKERKGGPGRFTLAASFDSCILGRILTPNKLLTQMANRAVEERLLLFERALDPLRLLLRNGSLYEGTIENDSSDERGR